MPCYSWCGWCGWWGCGCEIVFILAVLCHTIEAAVAVAIATRRGVGPASAAAWGAQTFLLGGPSIRGLTAALNARDAARRELADNPALSAVDADWRWHASAR